MGECRSGHVIGIALEGIHVIEQLGATRSTFPFHIRGDCGNPAFVFGIVTPRSSL